MDSFAQLSPLVHLTALKLDDVRFDQATLEQARLTPLFGVRKLEFCRVKYLTVLVYFYDFEKKTARREQF